MNRRQVVAAALTAALAVDAGEVAAQPPVAAPPSKTPLFPDDGQFWFETLRMFGADEYGGASPGEVLAASARIKAGDYDSWYDAWNEMADRIATEGEAQLAKAHDVSARDSLLRASNYYRSSEFFLHANPRDPRIERAYQRSVGSYKGAAGRFDPAIKPVEIPYEATTLPGYLHRVDRSPRQRPLLIMHTGFDGSAEEMHWSGARAAVERGYNVLAFDGPGQFGPLHRQGLTFRPDWEHVVTPVVDFALHQPGVDPRRIALMGISLGGELAPRAAAFEHRLAALIANDGVYDFGANLAPIPEPQRAGFVAMLQAKEAPGLDQQLQRIMASTPAARWAFAHGMYAFGVASPRAFLRAALDYNLRDGVAEKISCPTLVCYAEDDQFMNDQPRQLYDHLTCKKTLIGFSRQEGAGAHCEMGAGRLAFARIFDWLDETLRAA